MTKPIALRLEEYTLKRKQEVLLVTVDAGGELETVAIFNGFSSSLTNPTPYNPDIPVIAADAKIVAIDRLESPYNPNEPKYIQSNLSLAEMEQLLGEVNIGEG